MTIELSELAGRVSELRDCLRAGGVVTLTDAGTALGTVTPEPTGRPSRVFDMHLGAFETSDDFDDPLPDEFWLGGNP